MSHYPPYTPKEILGTVLMAAGALIAILLLATYAEPQIQRSARVGMPHVVKERTSK